jgi:hypothetical protein
MNLELAPIGVCHLRAGCTSQAVKLCLTESVGATLSVQRVG